MQEVCSQDLRPGDIIKVVNQRIDQDVKVVRKSGHQQPPTFLFPVAQDRCAHRYVQGDNW